MQPQRFLDRVPTGGESGRIAQGPILLDQNAPERRRSQSKRRIDLAALLAELLPRQGFRALESVVTRVLLAGWRPPMPVPRPIEIPEPAPVIDETW